VSCLNVLFYFCVRFLAAHDLAASILSAVPGYLNADGESVKLYAIDEEAAQALLSKWRLFTSVLRCNALIMSRDEGWSRRSHDGDIRNTTVRTVLRCVNQNSSTMIEVVAKARWELAPRRCIPFWHFFLLISVFRFFDYSGIKRAQAVVSPRFK